MDFSDLGGQSIDFSDLGGEAIGPTPKKSLMRRGWDARSTDQENAYNSTSAKALTNETFAALCRSALSLQVE